MTKVGDIMVPSLSNPRGRNPDDKLRTQVVSGRNTKTLLGKVPSLHYYVIFRDTDRMSIVRYQKYTMIVTTIIDVYSDGSHYYKDWFY